MIGPGRQDRSREPAAGGQHPLPRDEAVRGAAGLPRRLGRRHHAVRPQRGDALHQSHEDARVPRRRACASRARASTTSSSRMAARDWRRSATAQPGSSRPARRRSRPMSSSTGTAPTRSSPRTRGSHVGLDRHAIATALERRSRNRRTTLVAAARPAVLGARTIPAGAAASPAAAPAMRSSSAPRRSPATAGRTNGKPATARRTTGKPPTSTAPSIPAAATPLARQRPASPNAGTLARIE